MPASEGRLIGEAEGEIENEDGVLVIRRIHVRLRLKAAPDHRETAERVHGFFADRCPIYRTLKAAIAISTELVFEPLDDEPYSDSERAEDELARQELARGERITLAEMKREFGP